MPRFLFTFFSISALLVLLTPAANAQMLIPASFAVSPSGASTYSIPIDLPPGVAGMQPQLSLDYNSQAGNGLMGMGWRLSGISGITRCPRVMKYDGVNGAVNFDANDRLCLDGERLLLVSGTYGQGGSEYRTAIDNFSRIRAYGTAGSGPLYFVVQTKSGNTIEYGKTANARDEPSQSNVRTWMSNSIVDIKGNYIAISYTIQSRQQPMLLDTIIYGANNRHFLAETNIKFDYDAERSDTNLVYQADRPLLQINRLKRIKASVDWPQWTYQLSYSTSPTTGRTILSSVKRCAELSTTDCLPPINLDYQTQDTGAISRDIQAHGTGGEGSQLANLFGDGRAVYWTRGGFGHFASRLNSDGTAQSWNWQGHGTGSDGWQMANIFGTGRDIYWTHSGGSHFATQLNDDGTAQSWNWGGHGVGTSGNWRFVDLFGDGHPVYWTRSGSTHYATRLNQDGTWQSWNWSAHGLGSNGWDFADLFGTGRQLYYTRSGGVHYASQLNADGTQQSWTWNGQTAGTEGSRLVDLFGDGRHEFWTRSAGTHSATRFNPDGTSQDFRWNAHGTGSDGWDFADLFGNGRQVYWTHGGTHHYFSVLSPDGTAQNFDGEGAPKGEKNRFADLFGIGRQVYWSRVGFTHYASRFNTDGTITNWSWGGHGEAGEGMELANLYGDGQAVYWTRGAGNHYTTSFARGLPDVLTNISNQPNADTSIQIKYSTLVGLGSAYDKGNSPSYPIVSVPVNYPVTQSVDIGNGIGGISTVKYAYEGLKADISGGVGILGFASTTATDTTPGGPGTIVQSRYSQQWPIIGVLLEKITVMPGLGRTGQGVGIERMGLVASNTRSYGFGAGSASNSIFVYPTEVIEEIWDANGAAMPATGTRYQYAQSPQYGDVTSVRTLTGMISKTVTNMYSLANTVSEKWILGRLIRATVLSEQTSEPVITKSTDSNQPLTTTIITRPRNLPESPIIVAPAIRGGIQRRPGQEE